MDAASFTMTPQRFEAFVPSGAGTSDEKCLTFLMCLTFSSCFSLKSPKRKQKKVFTSGESAFTFTFTSFVGYRIVRLQ